MLDSNLLCIKTVCPDAHIAKSEKVINQGFCSSNGLYYNEVTQKALDGAYQVAYKKFSSPDSIRIDNGYFMLYGRSGVGKTFFAEKLVQALANDLSTDIVMIQVKGVFLVEQPASAKPAIIYFGPLMEYARQQKGKVVITIDDFGGALQSKEDKHIVNIQKIANDRMVASLFQEIGNDNTIEKNKGIIILLTAYEIDKLLSLHQSIESFTRRIQFIKIGEPDINCVKQIFNSELFDKLYNSTLSAGSSEFMQTVLEIIQDALFNQETNLLYAKILRITGTYFKKKSSSLLSYGMVVQEVTQDCSILCKKNDVYNSSLDTQSYVMVFNKLYDFILDNSHSITGHDVLRKCIECFVYQIRINLFDMSVELYEDKVEKVISETIKRQLNEEPTDVRTVMSEVNYDDLISRLKALRSTDCVKGVGDDKETKDIITVVSDVNCDNLILKSQASRSHSF